MPTDEIFDFTLNPDDVPEDDEKFFEVGYESKLFIVNLGTLYLMFLIILLIPVFLLLTRPCKTKSRWLTNKHHNLINSLHGNMFIRYLIEGCLDIANCIVINFLYQKD